MMPVKRSQSALRVLTVVEGIARHQPIGVSELARLVGDDKSAVQRAIMTLADAGWIRTAIGTATKWQLTAHILALAHMGNASNDLRQRVRGTLESLRDATGESVLLTVPDIRRFVVVDAAESRHVLRTVHRIGVDVPVTGSATSRALLPYMSAEQQSELLGRGPDARQLAEFAETRKRGYAVSVGDVLEGSTNIAAPILDSDGHPLGAIVVSGPSERLPAKRHAKIGDAIVQGVRSLLREAH
jgi:IclR family acetate operon transcriptional repressor